MLPFVPSTRCATARAQKKGTRFEEPEEARRGPWRPLGHRGWASKLPHWGSRGSSTSKKSIDWTGTLRRGRWLSIQEARRIGRLCTRSHRAGAATRVNELGPSLSASPPPPALPAGRSVLRGAAPRPTRWLL